MEGTAIAAVCDFIKADYLIDENCTYKVLNFQDKMDEEINGKFLSFIYPFLYPDNECTRVIPDDKLCPPVVKKSLNVTITEGVFKYREDDFAN